MDAVETQEKSFWQLLRSVWPLMLGILMLVLGNGLQFSLLGLRAVDEGFSTETIGLISTGFYLGFLMGSKAAVAIVAQVGHVRVFAGLASLASISVLVHAAFPDPAVWIGARTLSGFCYAGIYVVAESWLNDSASNRNRGLLLGLYMVVMVGGLAGGQLFLTVAPVGAYELFLLSSVLISASFVPILLVAGQPPAIGKVTGMKITSLLREAPFAVATCIMTSFCQGAVMGLGAVYGRAAGLDTVEIALLMAAFFIGGILSQWPIGYISDRMDRRRVVIASALLAGVAALWVAFAGSSLGLFAGLAVLGAALFPLYSLSLALANDRLDPSQFVAASSALVLLQGLGAAAGPSLASFAMRLEGPDALFLIVAVISLVLIIYGLYRVIRRPAAEEAERASIVAAPAMISPIGAEANAEVARERAESNDPD